MLHASRWCAVVALSPRAVDVEVIEGGPVGEEPLVGLAVQASGRFSSVDFRRSLALLYFRVCSECPGPGSCSMRYGFHVGPG